jgi:hypothetical protein
MAWGASTSRADPRKLYSFAVMTVETRELGQPTRKHETGREQGYFQGKTYAKQV